MEQSPQVLEFKCPCCNAGLVFRDGTRELKCEYCDNTFDMETIEAYASSEQAPVEEVNWEESQSQDWSEAEQETIRTFHCPSCAGEILTDDVTAATFCPYCDNPTILPSRLNGSKKPDAILPFQNSREDAKAAFLQLCKGKPLLPRGFAEEQRLERIAGVYVPFWLYDCDGDFDGSYKATRIRHWSDSRYNYTKTDHYLLKRSAGASFDGIPMDGSSKMEDTFMESIEPFDYSQMQDFEMAYLTGYLADQYDIPSEQGDERIRQRVDETIRAQLAPSLAGYTTVLPTSHQLRVNHSRAKYVLLPVWILNTKYRDKVYTFAMNGQTGKITGTFPACPKRTAAWFAGICGSVTAALTIFRLLLALL